MYCPYCGKAIDEGQVFCAQCGARLAGDAAPPLDAGGRSKTPWEDRENAGAFNGLMKTVKAVILTPADFFRNMRVQGGLTDPLLFAMIIGMIGLLFVSAWDILLRDSLRNCMLTDINSAAGSGMTADFASPLGAVMMPFLLIFWIFIAAGMLHLFLMVLHGANAGFEATFRVVCYSTSPFLCMAVPLCGMPVTVLWVLTIVIIGLREAHETSGGKTVIAVLFPFLLCCGVLAAGAVLLMGAAAASLGALMQMYQ